MIGLKAGRTPAAIPASVPSRMRGWRWLVVAGLLVLTPGLFRAQVTIQGKLKNFRFPEYYAGAAPGQTNQALKTLLSGSEAWQLPGGQVRINGLRIETFQENGRRELEVKAAECLFDLGTREASGAGHLEVSSASGLFTLQGDGFQWRQSNAVLIVSNHVLTTLQRALVASRALPLESLTNTPPPTDSADSNALIRISSDSCLLDSQSNRVVQSGHVVVDDPQMQLGCDTLQVQFSPARRLQQLVAEGSVSILSKADQSRATADRATYELDQGRETIGLTGQPVWRDREGRLEARADRFQFDRTAREIRGEGGAQMRLPRGNFTQPPLALSRPAAATKAPSAGADTNQILITAGTLTLLLPATNSPYNRPYRSAIAEKEVVILSPADNTRATGDKAVYREDTGLIELMGQARWEAAGRLVSAQVLSMDRTNKVFQGRGDVLFRLPLQSAGQSALFRASSNRPPSTNLVLEIRCQQMDYRTNILQFGGGQVRTRLLDNQVVRGLMTCGLLTAHFGERLERVVAEKHVLAEHYPSVRPGGKVTTNVLSCETLAAGFSPDGQTVTLEANENVQAARVELSPGKPKAQVTELTCERLTVLIRPKTGRAELVVAEQHVVISQDDKLARGGRAQFNDRENRVVLSDHPYAEFAQGKITRADELIWDRATGKFRGHGPYLLELAAASLRTNAFRLPFFKK